MKANFKKTLPVPSRRSPQEKTLLNTLQFHPDVHLRSTLGARGFFFSKRSCDKPRFRDPAEREKKTLWTQQLQTSLPCDFETKHLTKPVFGGSVCFSICMSARGATMRETGQKLSQDKEERN